MFGKGAEGLARMIEDILAKQGEPNGYIVGREGGGAIFFGARYGSGTLFHKIEGQKPVYWRGPSLGLDLGANAANTFVLVYNLYNTEELFETYGAAEGAGLSRRRVQRLLPAQGRRGADPGPRGRRAAARAQRRLHEVLKEAEVAAVLTQRAGD